MIYFEAKTIFSSLLSLSCKLREIMVRREVA